MRIDRVWRLAPDVDTRQQRFRLLQMSFALEANVPMNRMIGIEQLAVGQLGLVFFGIEISKQ